MRYLFEFDDYKSRESKTRTKSLTDEEFLSLLRNECKNFTFSNDLLWRGTKNSFGKFGIYLEAERAKTIGDYSYKDFFNFRKEYPVPRYKSLIGSTEKEGAEFLASEEHLYLVIPFDNISIIFAGSPDLALWSKKDQEFTDKLFIMKQYEKDFKVPTDDLFSILRGSKLSSYEDIFKSKKLGFEYFTNGSCLLLAEDKVEWLRSII